MYRLEDGRVRQFGPTADQVPEPPSSDYRHLVPNLQVGNPSEFTLRCRTARFPSRSLES
jgi:hypothetical protein